MKPTISPACIEAVKAFDMQDQFGDDIDARHAAEEAAVSTLSSAITAAEAHLALASSHLQAEN